MINITKGETKVFTVKVRDQNGDPFDLTNFDKFKVCLPNIAGTQDVTEVASANGSVTAISGSPLLGKIQVTLNYLDTTNLSEGTGQNIGLVVDNAMTPNPRPKNTDGALNVYPAVCP